MSKLTDFIKLITGRFDNKEQFDKMQAEGKTYPYAKHINTACNDKIKNLPENFKGTFVVEESYYETDGKSHASPHLFLISENNEGIVLSSYDIPNGEDKNTFSYDSMKAVDYSELNESKKFTPALYREKDGVWEGGIMAMVEKIKNKLRGNGFLLAVTIVLFFVLYIAGAILYGDRNFTSPQVFLNLFISNAGLIIAAVGMTFVLITGGIDISIGSVIGVVCMMLAWMMEVKHMSAVVAIILVLAFGVIFGLVQGFLVAYLKIQPFIVTLGGMFFARGLTALISSDMISIENPTFLSLANYRIYFGFITYYNNRGVAMHPYIYLSVVIALLVVAISFVILRYTKFGRAVFAVGGNEQSALLMGLNPKVTKLKVYVLNGFLASLAGFAFCLNSCGGFVEQARGFEMDAIAAAVIGGTLLTGGVGTVVGSLFGSLIKGIIETIITFQGTLSSWWTRIVIALLLCFFVILQSVFKSIREKRLAQGNEK